VAKPIVIAGLGLGDEGKGSTVDALVRKFKSDLVVRYNGGAQAAHNVIDPSGAHHCFSQFGSGTFAGADTLLSRYMLVNPISFLREAASLLPKVKELGVRKPTVYVEMDALVTTPFHIAANRIREMSRTGRHGSCGMGIGETMSDYVDGKDCLFVGDLTSSDLKRKLLQILDRKRNELLPLLEGVDTSPNTSIGYEWSVFNSSRFVDLAMGYYGTFNGMVEVVDELFLEEALDGDTPVVFEGAQGVLLDQDFGFQPYTTWTDCTFGNAKTLMGYSHISNNAVYLGILRAYHTRHGNGPFPTENSRYTACSAHDHNTLGEWQGAFRSGPFDLVLAKYALDVIGGVGGIVMTNLDRLDHAWGDLQICTSYRDPSETWVDRLPVERPVNLDRQACLAKWLTEIQPVYEPISGHRYAEAVTEMLGVDLVMKSSGPTAKEKEFLKDTILDSAV
jgi:adenylosuccinate synthase